MEDVDVENDVFQLTNFDNDGVCITSLEVNNKQVTVGMSDQPNFWLDGDTPNCSSDIVATPQITIQNGQVTTDNCSGEYSDTSQTRPFWSSGLNEYINGFVKVISVSAWLQVQVKIYAFTQVQMDRKITKVPP